MYLCIDIYVPVHTIYSYLDVYDTVIVGAVLTIMVVVKLKGIEAVVIT